MQIPSRPYQLTPILYAEVCEVPAQVWQAHVLKHPSLRFEPAYRQRIRAWNDPWGGSPGIRSRVGEESFGLIASTAR